MSGLLALVFLLAQDAGVLDAAASTADAAASAPAPKPVGPPPTANLTCAPSPVRVGEPLKCTLVITHRKDVSVTLTAPAGAVPDAPTPAQPQGDGLVTTRTFTVRAKSLRPLRVDGVAVVWQEASGGQDTLQVPTQKIPVKSVVEGAQDPQFRTFKAPPEDADRFWAAHGPVPYRITNWPLIIALSTLGVLAVGFGIGWLVRRWLKARAQVEVEWVDPRPAHVIALAELDALALQNLPAAGEIKPYYTRLSEIVRAYLERRFQFTALEMTSDEIRAEVAALSLSDEARRVIAGFLDESDLVKFADFRPDETTTDAAMRYARGLVELTRVPDAPPPDAAPMAPEAAS